VLRFSFGFPLRHARLAKPAIPGVGTTTAVWGPLQQASQGRKPKKKLRLINKLFQIVSESMRSAVGDIPH
jgi:hypothetical protein